MGKQRASEGVCLRDAQKRNSLPLRPASRNTFTLKVKCTREEMGHCGCINNEKTRKWVSKNDLYEIHSESAD
jgi:hypothetical protein